MKNLLVNEDACIGCGSCIAVDPEHFDFNDDGLATVISNNNLETNSVINAVGSCPTNAISINEKVGCSDCSSCPGCSSVEETCSCGDDCSCTEENNCGCNCFEK